jgi:hypothetical protein
MRKFRFVAGNREVRQHRRRAVRVARRQHGRRRSDAQQLHVRRLLRRLRHRRVMLKSGRGGGQVEERILERILRRKERRRARAPYQVRVQLLHVQVCGMDQGWTEGTCKLETVESWISLFWSK